MANVMLDILKVFFSGMSSEVTLFKVPVICKWLENFERKMNIRSRHLNSNFAYHIVIH